jgi:hypothetical protein
MRKTAIFHKFMSSDTSRQLEDSTSTDNQGTSWKERPSTGISINSLDFSELTGEIQVNPSYTYCLSCRRGTAPISLRGKDLRPRATFSKSFQD